MQKDDYNIISMLLCTYSWLKYYVENMKYVSMNNKCVKIVSSVVNLSVEQYSSENSNRKIAINITVLKGIVFIILFLLLMEKASGIASCVNIL